MDKSFEIKFDENSRLFFFEDFELLKLLRSNNHRISVQSLTQDKTFLPPFTINLHQACHIIRKPEGKDLLKF